MLVAAENYEKALEFSKKFSLDPKHVLETLAEKCGKEPQFAVSTGWKMLKQYVVFLSSLLFYFYMDVFTNFDVGGWMRTMLSRG